MDIDNAVLNFAPGTFLLLNGVLAIVMFSVALDIEPAKFRAVMRAPKAFVTGLVSQFVVLPALTFLLVLAVQPRGSIALGLILVAACPGGNISNFITHRAGGNAALAISLTAFTTIGAILLTPLNIAFWGSLYPPARELLTSIYIDPVQVAMTVSLMLILPLVLGMVVNRNLPRATARLRRPMQQLSMLIYLGFIVVALYANWTFLLAFGAAIIPLVIAHNAIALSGGYLTATAAGLAPYDRRAISIETGIQNSGLGLALIFSFFHGLGGMAIVAAFWGVWHAISGLTIARIFARTEAAR